MEAEARRWDARRARLAAVPPPGGDDDGSSTSSGSRRFRDARFAASETERIARIMRGPLTGWRDSVSSSTDDEQAWRRG